MVHQPWHPLHSSLQYQTHSLFLTSNLGCHVKQDFLTPSLSSYAAVYGFFEVKIKGENRGNGHFKWKLFRNFSEVSLVFLERITWV